MNASTRTSLWVLPLVLVFANACEVKPHPFISPPAAPAQGPTYETDLVEQHDTSTRKALQTVIPKLDFTNLEFKDVVEFFRCAAEVNIHVNWPALQAANVDGSTPVNLSLTGPTVNKAMEMVLQDLSSNTKVSYAIVDGVVLVSTRDELSKSPVRKLYPASDILEAMCELHPLPKLVVPDQASNNASAEPVREHWQVLAETISREVEPSSWTCGTGGSVEFLNGDLIVVQTLENHRQVADLLASIRQSIDKKRIAFGLAVVRLDEGQDVKGLRTALTESKDIAATLQQAAGDKKASVAVDRCRIQQGFLTRPVQLVQSGAEYRSYDVTVTPVERKSDGVSVQAKVSSTWVAAKVGKVDKDAPPVPISVSDKDDYKVVIPPGGFQLIELIPTDAKGGAAVLVVWIPK